MLITGGSSGIGLALAEHCAARGSAVSIVARDVDRLARARDAVVAAAPGARVAAAPADVTDPGALGGAVATLVDDLGPHEVAVFGCGGSTRIAPWGELLSTAARARGAAGCLTDGYVRDIRAIRRMGFPVFHAGIAPLDSKGRGKVAEIDVPIACAGVRVTPGDLVFGDADGVVVVPQAVEANVLDRAFAKVRGENRTREELEQGAKLADVFARHGIL